MLCGGDDRVWPGSPSRPSSRLQPALSTRAKLADRMCHGRPPLELVQGKPSTLVGDGQSRLNELKLYGWGKPMLHSFPILQTGGLKSRPFSSSHSRVLTPAAMCLPLIVDRAAMLLLLAPWLILLEPLARPRSAGEAAALIDPLLTNFMMWSPLAVMGSAIWAAFARLSRRSSTPECERYG